MHLQLSAKDWRQINHLIETPFTVSAPALSTVTSSHVDTQASLKDDAPEESTSGFGSSTASNMLRNPFCFLVQVSQYLPAKCYRSDNRFLVLLLCPIHVNSAVTALSCGDVESNPGPTEKEMSQLLSGQSSMTASINNVLSKQSRIEKDIADLKERMLSLETHLSTLSSLQNDVINIKTTVTDLEKNVSSLLCKVDELENRGRRNSLIMYGLNEQEGETNDSLLNMIKEDVFKERLGLTINNVERCHRLGRKKEKARPVILRFLDYRDKSSVLKECRKLKGTTVSITEDFSLKVREIRMKLWQSSQQERDQGSKVKLVFDKCSIECEMFVWDVEKD
ncbi:uncharacterized protein LOC125947075 isoform X1 [Dermacentor silvarum]|uniref:uncharacterized protein LOC125947075 isoform X1 n=1 Tax=Dermacentor silvarum TaxID=543639 RepID=UPI002100E348|nr:uncharacterized protein LOC125947075 isoform X1 [Dermacentor silvarum]